MDLLLSCLPGETTSVLLGVFVCLLAAYYYYLTANFNYWSKQGISGPKPKIFIGNFNFKKPIYEIDVENRKKYGGMYGIYEGRNPVLLISDPDLIRQVTIKDFSTFPFTRAFPKIKGDRVVKYFITGLRGEEWKQVRSVLSPTFTTGKLKQMTYLIDECCSNLVNKYLLKFAENKEPFDVKKQMSSFTLDVITSVAFGIKMDTMENPDCELVSKARDIFNPKAAKYFMMIYMIMPGLFSLIPAKLFTWKENPWDYFVDTISKVLQEKRQKTVKRNDFLQILLDAKAEENDEQNGDQESSNDSEKSSNAANTKSTSSRKVLSEELIIGQAVLFLLAGHDSVASTISHTLYLLALNTDVQDKAREEVDEVLNEFQDKLNYESVSKMQYLDMVVSETLRIYPFTSRVERTCVENGYELNGVKLRKGMMVVIPSYAIHHDQKYYPEPEKFLPERFTPEAKAKRDPMVYLPFGAGPRHCVAMRFALMEVKMVVATILRKYFVKKCEQTQVPLEYTPGNNLLLAKDITLTVEERT